MPKPPRRDRDENLPGRDDVEAMNRAADRAAEARRADAPDRIEVAAFRPGFAHSAAVVAPALVVVGLLVLLPYAFATPLGARQLDRLGFGALLGGWLVLVLAATAAAVLAIGVLRAVSTGQRRYGRRDVVRLAAGDAAAAAAAAAGVSFLAAGGLDDVSRVMAFTFVLTGLFTWAMLVPLYRRGWERVAGDRGIRF